MGFNKLGPNSPLLGIGITLKDGLEYQYAISIAGNFMLMWTVLLIWADKKPIERKGILVILIFVILGLRITMLFGYISKLISFSKLLFDTIMSLSYLTFIIFSLIITRNFENSI